MAHAMTEPIERLLFIAQHVTGHFPKRSSVFSFPLSALYERYLCLYGEKMVIQILTCMVRRVRLVDGFFSEIGCGITRRSVELSLDYLMEPYAEIGESVVFPQEYLVIVRTIYPVRMRFIGDLLDIIVLIQYDNRWFAAAHMRSMIVYQAHSFGIRIRARRFDGNAI